MHLPGGTRKEGETWTDDNGGIVVAFDKAGRVTERGWPGDGSKWSPKRIITRLRN
jgi:hypothetical protein